MQLSELAMASMRCAACVDQLQVGRDPRGNSGDIMRMQAVLTGVRKVVKKYEYKDKDDDRKPLVHLIKNVFPLLLNIFSTLLAQHSEAQAGMMIKTICKIYWSATQYKIDKVLQTKGTYAKWHELFVGVVSKTLSEAEQPADASEREAWPWESFVAIRPDEIDGAPLDDLFADLDCR